MERVGILINKLQEQLMQKADVKSLLVTSQMLQAELMQHAQKQNGQSLSRVSVVLPFNPLSIYQPLDVPETLHTSPDIIPADQPYKPAIKPPETTEQLQTEEHKQEPEPEMPVSTFQDAGESKNGTIKQWLFHASEVPTLAHQEKPVFELNDTIITGRGSLNELLNEDKAEVGHAHQGSPIKDLKKAISINDRHRFIKDLFRDDETMYERSIKTINGFNIFPEAEYWIQRELKLKVGWDSNHESVKLFDQLVKRRFS